MPKRREAARSVGNANLRKKRMRRTDGYGSPHSDLNWESAHSQRHSISPHSQTWLQHSVPSLHSEFCALQKGAPSAAAPFEGIHTAMAITTDIPEIHSFLNISHLRRMVVDAPQTHHGSQGTRDHFQDRISLTNPIRREIGGVYPARGCLPPLQF